MRLLGGDGVPVRFVPCATDDALEVADDVAVGLLDAGWPPESVALLTTYRRHPVQVERQAAGRTPTGPRTGTTTTCSTGTSSGSRGWSGRRWCSR